VNFGPVTSELCIRRVCGRRAGYMLSFATHFLFRLDFIPDFIYMLERCTRCDIELAFLLDASTKSGASDWQNVLNFVNSVAANFNVNQNCVRVAVVRYAETTDVSIPFNRYGDVNSLRQAVQRLTIIGGGSNLATALRVLRTRVFASNVVHQGATLVAGIVMDRLSCNSQILTEVAALRNMHVMIFGVASTSQVDTSCLRQIVTSNRYIEAHAHSQLSNYVSQAVPYACIALFSKFPSHLYVKFYLSHAVQLHLLILS